MENVERMKWVKEGIVLRGIISFSTSNTTTVTFCSQKREAVDSRAVQNIELVVAITILALSIGSL